MQMQIYSSVKWYIFLLMGMYVMYSFLMGLLVC